MLCFFLILFFSLSLSFFFTLNSLDTSNSNKPVSLHLTQHHSGSSVRRLAFTANEHNLVSAAKSIKIFDLNHGKVIRKINAGPNKVYSLLVVDQFLLCAGDDRGRFRVWDYREDRGCMMDLKECDDYISDLDVDSDRRIVVAASGEGTLSAFNLRWVCEKCDDLVDGGRHGDYLRCVSRVWSLDDCVSL